MSAADVMANVRELTADAALAHAQRLADSGRFEDAIAYASEANKTLQAPELERSLVVWRQQGFAARKPEAPRGQWPPVASDLFSDVPGPPQVRGASGLTGQALAAGVVGHGCLIVRGLFDHDEVERFKRSIDGALSAMAQTKRGEANAESEIWYRPLPMPHNPELEDGRFFAERENGVWTADCPRGLFNFVDVIKGKGIDRVVGDYLGEAPVLSVGKSTLRRVEPKDTPEVWHQDGAFLGLDTRTVNMWIALSHCGEDAPGLDMVPRRLPGLVQAGSDGVAFPWAASVKVATEAAAGAVTDSPIFEPGDALFFDQVFLHRTQGRPGFIKRRYAIESWFFAPSTFPTVREGLLL